MRHLLPYIVIVLLICVYIIDEDNERKNSLRKEHDYQQQLDSIQSKLRSTELERDSLRLHSDSLVHSYTAIQLTLDKVNSKLRDVPGTYDALTNKELQDKMIDRWKKRGK